MRYYGEGRITPTGQISRFDRATNTYIFYRELPQPKAQPVRGRELFAQLYSLPTPGIENATVWKYLTQAPQERQPSPTHVLRLTLSHYIPGLAQLWPLTTLQNRKYNIALCPQDFYQPCAHVPYSLFPKNPLGTEALQNGLTDITLEVPFNPDTSNIPLIAPTPVTAIYVTINRPPASSQLWQLVRRVKRTLKIDNIPEFVTLTLRPEPLNTQEPQNQWPLHLQAIESGVQLILPDNDTYFQLHIATNSVGPFYMGTARYMPEVGVTMWGVM